MVSLPSKHKVFHVTEFNGSIDDIKQSTEELPEVGPEDVLIKVKAASLNQRDLMILSGVYPFPTKKNVVPCSDFSGEIVGRGKNVSPEEFADGQRVIGNFSVHNLYGPPKRVDDSLGGNIDGGLREYVTLPSFAVNKIPKSVDLSWEELSTLPCAGVTAWNGLYGLPGAPLIAGQTVLALGTGGVSAIGLAIAKAAGAKTIVTSSSDEKLAKIQAELKVDHVVNYAKNPNWSEEVLRLTDGRGVDIVLENGGSGTLKESILSLTTGGQVSIIGLIAPAKQEDMPDVGPLALSKNAIVRGIIVGSKALADDFIRFLSQNKIPLAIDRVFKFEDSVEAYKYFKSAKHVGKVVISLN
ncbi:Zta1p [Sugiyamaella lignohabitans]|uniref:Zta1p n=1 Tax=Sugiyamaella lignohabitans TaxID=796027 RepID=A0A167DJ57_9ASCO|nr:Zta1p [Sugiyamaella lignohabitans]ANB12975.1 Zta1p [Sugiyamaella lignohabitans]